MMTATAVANDLYSVEAVVDVRVLRHPELFTSLAGNGGVVAPNNCIAEEGLLLANDSADVLLELESVKLRALPRGEPSTLSVIVATGQEQLRPNHQDALVEAEHTAVVESVLEVDWHSDVAKKIPRKVPVRQDFTQRLPAVFLGVELEEVILAAVARDLKLWTDSVRGTNLSGVADGTNDVVLVVGKAHGPLVDLADGHHRVLLMHCWCFGFTRKNICTK